MFDHAHYNALLKSCRSLAQVKDVRSRIASSQYRGDLGLQSLVVKMLGRFGAMEDARAAFQCISEPSQFSWNILLSAFAQNGLLREAKSVFDGMPWRDSVSWNSLLTAHAHHGHLSEVQALFTRMPLQTLVAWTVFIAAVSQAGHLDYADYLFHEMPERDVISWTTLLSSHARRGHLGLAREVFDRVPLRSLVTWNVMLGAYGEAATAGGFERSKQLFDAMPERDIVSWTNTLVACAQNGKLREASYCFARMPQVDLVSWTAMVTGLALGGELKEARKLFELMFFTEQPAEAWNALITAYGQAGNPSEAIHLFRTMDLRGIRCTKVTLVNIFNTCGMAPHFLPLGKTVHASAAAALPVLDENVENALVDMYGKCGDFDGAKAVFDCMAVRGVVSWTSYLCACVHNSSCDQALQVFRLMDIEGIAVDDVAFTAAIDACTNLKFISQGRVLHFLVRDSKHGCNAMVYNALVNMYAKCGALDEARSLFDSMPDRGIVSWSTMVNAYAQAGHVSEALYLFQGMKLEGIHPNEVLFVEILHLCSHRGRLQDAWSNFVSMVQDHDLQPKVEHYACILDLLGRSGELGDAQDLLRFMPFEPDDLLWTTLMGACNNQETAAAAAELR